MSEWQCPVLSGPRWLQMERQKSTIKQLWQDKLILLGPSVMQRPALQKKLETWMLHTGLSQAWENLKERVQTGRAVTGPATALCQHMSQWVSHMCKIQQLRTPTLTFGETQLLLCSPCSSLTRSKREGVPEVREQGGLGYLLPVQLRGPVQNHPTQSSVQVQVLVSTAQMRSKLGGYPEPLILNLSG